jgi:hypothetical protein
MKDIVISLSNDARLVYRSDEKFPLVCIERYDEKYGGGWYNSSINGFFFSPEEFPKIVEALNKIEKLLVLK